MNNKSIGASLKAFSSSIDWWLLCSVALITVMVYARDLEVYAFSPLYFLAAVSLISVILSYNSLQKFFFFYIVAGCGINAITYIPLLIVLVLKSKKRNVWQFLFPILILLLEFFHFSSCSFQTKINDFIVYSLTISSFFVILFDDNMNDKDLKDGIKYYVIGTVAVLLLIIINSAGGYGSKELLLSAARIGEEEGGIDFGAEMVTKLNPNQMACFSVVAIALVLYIKDLFKLWPIKVIILILFIFAGILSSSRTWILTLAIVLVYYFSFSRLKGKFVFVLFSIIALFALFQYADITEAIVDRFTGRFEEANFRTAGGRTELFEKYNEWMLSHPENIPFGTGALYYRKICNVGYSCHNGTQQIYICYGIAGILLFLFCGIRFYKKFCKRKKISLWGVFPFISCLLFTQSGQLLNPAIMMLPFLATLLPLKMNEIPNQHTS